MPRLIRAGALAAFLLSLPVSASVVIGRQQPAPSLSRLLRLADCPLPCWIGIVPGKTTVGEARERIRIAYAAMPGASLAFDPVSSFSLLWVSLGKRDNGLGSIGIRLDTRGDGVIDTIAFDLSLVGQQGQVTLADLYALYGAPPGVARLDPGVNSPNDLALVYGDEERGAIVFAPPAQAAPWTQHASLLVFYADHAMPLAPSVELRPWRGFSQLTYLGR